MLQYDEKGPNDEENLAMDAALYVVFVEISFKKSRFFPLDVRYGGYTHCDRKIR